MTRKKVGRKKIGDLTKKNEKALEDYTLIVKSKFDSKTTQINNINPVDKLLRDVAKDFDKITLSDILKWLGRISS